MLLFPPKLLLFGASVGLANPHTGKRGGHLHGAYSTCRSGHRSPFFIFPRRLPGYAVGSPHRPFVVPGKCNGKAKQGRASRYSVDRTSALRLWLRPHARHARCTHARMHWQAGRYPELGPSCVCHILNGRPCDPTTSLPATRDDMVGFCLELPRLQGLEPSMELVSRVIAERHVLPQENGMEGGEQIFNSIQHAF